MQKREASASLFWSLNLRSETLREIADRLEEPELTALKRAYGQRVEELWPAGTQLSYETERAAGGADDEMFRI